MVNAVSNLRVTDFMPDPLINHPLLLFMPLTFIHAHFYPMRSL